MSRAQLLFGIDLRSLAAFRIGLGMLLLADLAYRALDFQAHYTDAGILPRGLYLEIFSDVEIAWSVHLALGSTIYQTLLFLIAAVAALALLLGVHTRAAVGISWLLLVSVHNRQPLVLSGSDMILRLLLFWSFFLPLSHPPGVDRRLTEPMDAPRSRVELSAASVALLVQVALIYVFSVIHKLLNPAWTQLAAIQDSMRVEGVATPLGSGLLAYPALLRVATASTLAIELVLPLLAFVPWATARIRIGVVVAMWAFHLFGIGGVMNLGLFEYVMALAWVPFLPSLFWDRLAPRVEAARVRYGLGSCILGRNRAERVRGVRTLPRHRRQRCVPRSLSLPGSRVDDLSSAHASLRTLSGVAAVVDTPAQPLLRLQGVPRGWIRGRPPYRERAGLGSPEANVAQQPLVEIPAASEPTCETQAAARVCGLSDSGLERQARGRATRRFAGAGQDRRESSQSADLEAAERDALAWRAAPIRMRKLIVHDLRLAMLERFSNRRRLLVVSMGRDRQPIRSVAAASRGQIGFTEVRSVTESTEDALWDHYRRRASRRRRRSGSSAFASAAAFRLWTVFSRPTTNAAGRT